MNYLAWLVLATVSSSSRAQTVYDDGRTHTVNGPSGPIEVLDSTTLNIVSPASVTGTELPGGIVYGIQTDLSSTLNLSGGQVNGTNAGPAILSLGSFTATGGSASGNVAAIVEGYGQISGGTFQGQTALSTNEVQSLSISGGVFNGTTALELYLFSAFHSTVTITGGVFTGLQSPPDLLYGSLSDYTFYNASSTVNISGGVFNGPMSFYLYNDSTVNFFGSNLNFDSTTDLLTGVLADGDSLNVIVYGYSNLPFVGQVDRSPDGDAITFIGPIFQAVPEPTSIVMATSGALLVLGIALGRARRRRHCAASTD
jgi:hypothetical protein